MISIIICNILNRGVYISY